MGCHPNPIDELIFFKMVETTNQAIFLQSSHACRRSWISVETLMLDVDMCTVQNIFLALERATSRPQNLAELGVVWKYCIYPLVN